MRWSLVISGTTQIVVGGCRGRIRFWFSRIQLAVENRFQPFEPHQGKLIGPLTSGFESCGPVALLQPLHAFNRAEGLFFMVFQRKDGFHLCHGLGANLLGPGEKGLFRLLFVSPVFRGHMFRPGGMAIRHP